MKRRRSSIEATLSPVRLNLASVADSAWDTNFHDYQAQFCLLDAYAPISSWPVESERTVESEKDKNAVVDIKIGPRHNDSFDLFDTYC